jgi:hypothetical protein
MSTRTTRPSLVSVYDGRKCLGFIFARGCRGYEAFSADERSLGVFLDQREALDAVTERAEAK